MIATNEIPWQNDRLEDKKINLGAAPIPYDNIEENHYNFTGGICPYHIHKHTIADIDIKTKLSNLSGFLIG